MKTCASGFVLLLVLTATVLMTARQSPANGSQEGASAWPELERDMEKMHAGMRSVTSSGNNDADFVKLMLPHHQAAIDMAKAELAYGKDPQMLRLAQEIITDQQSETELMQLWLKQHEPSKRK